MIFNSFEYLYFFIAVAVSYYALPLRFRWIMLLAASYYFYMSWKAPYVVLIVERITRTLRQSMARFLGLDRIPVLSHIYTVLCVAATFSLISFAWIFFRANSIADALYIATHLFTGIQKFNEAALYNLSLDKGNFYFGILAVAFMELFHFLHKRKDMRFMLSGSPLWMRWSVSYLLLLTVLLFGDYGNKPFIYFAF